MHGKGDALVPYKHTEVRNWICVVTVMIVVIVVIIDDLIGHLNLGDQYLYALAAPPKQIWIVEGSSHCGLYNSHKAEWEDMVFGFLRQHADVLQIQPQSMLVAEEPHSHAQAKSTQASALPMIID